MTAFSKNFFTAFLHLILISNTIKILIEKIRNLRLVIMSEYQNTKTFLPKQEVLVVSEIKNTVLWTYFISDLNREEIDASFFAK